VNEAREQSDFKRALEKLIKGFVEAMKPSAVVPYLGASVAAHFLLQEPTVAPCAGHDWVACNALGNSTGAAPILARSVVPISFFKSGEDHHCAHRLVHDRREERCLVMPFEEFLCCHACALQRVCWSEAELGGLPCGVAPLAPPKVASSETAAVAARL
jgi:hypothetical protein